MQWSPIIELRQYTLLPGKRDELISLFEAEFIESQEVCGAKIIGTFRDLDDPTKFVWLRGFANMNARQRALSEFYGGAVWKRHRDTANATMVDSDDVLLLRPARDDGAFTLSLERPALDSADGEDLGVVEATIFSLAEPADEGTLEHLHDERTDLFALQAGAVLGVFVTCEAENNFPVLPIREGEHVAVWFEGYPTRATYDASRARRALPHNAGAASRLPGSASRLLVRPPHVLRLEPTRRSLLTGLLAQVETPQTAGEAR